MANLRRGDSLSFRALASASNNPGNASMSTIAGGTSTAVSMSAFAIDAIGDINGYTYVVEETFDSYTLDITGSGNQFDKINLPQNFSWGIIPTGSNSTQYINITGSASASAQIYVSEMNPQAPESQSVLVTQAEHYISASFNDGFNDHATGYNTVKGKTIYSVDTYNNNTLLCLVATTPVLMYDGTEIEIGDLFEGDELLGYEINGLGTNEKDYLTWDTDELILTPVPVTVKSVIYSFSDIIYNINNGELRTTAEHPLLILDHTDNKYRFKEVGKLTTDDKLIKENQEVVIESIWVETSKNVEIVSIDVETQDTYVVNGYINHNKGGNEHTDLSLLDSIARTSPLIYLTPSSVDTDAVNDGDALSDTGEPTWADTSGNNWHATIGAGTFELASGSFSRQVRWASGSSWLDLPDTGALEFTLGTDEFTVIWRTGDTIGTQTNGYFVAKAASTTGARLFGVFCETTTNTATGWYLGGVNNAISIPIESNQLWIATVGTASANLWVDGTQEVTDWTGFGTGDYSVGQSWNIGTRTDGGYTFNGASMSLDIVAIIPKVISAQERSNIETEFISASVAPPSTGDSIQVTSPLLYYKQEHILPTSSLTEGDAITSWFDTGSLALTASVQGNPTVGIGKTGRHVVFDGNDWFDVTGSSALNLIPGTDSFTIVAREGDKLGDTIQGYFISKADNGSTLRSFGMGYSDITAGDVFGVAGGNSITINTGSMYNQPGNRLIMFEASTTTTKLYVNGVVYATGTTGTNTASASVNIGGRTDGSFILASGSSLDFVALIPKVLSSAERYAIENEFIYDYPTLPNLYGDYHGSATFPDSTNTPSWSTSGTVVATTESGSVYSGTTALRVAGSTTGAYIYGTWWNSTVEVGDLVRLSGRYLVEASSSNDGMTVLFFNSGAPSPTFHVYNLDESEEGVWKRFEVEYPKKVEAFFDIELESSDGTVIFDDLRITNLSAGAEQTYRSYNQQAIAYIDTASIQDPREQKAVNYLVRELKVNDLWSLPAPAIYPFVGKVSGSMKYNLADPRDTDDAFRIEYFREGTGTFEFNEKGMFTHATSPTDGAIAFTNYYIDQEWGANGVSSASLSGSMHAYQNIDLIPYTASEQAQVVASIWNGDGNAVIQSAFWDGADYPTYDFYYRIGTGGTNTVTGDFSYGGGRGMYSMFTSESRSKRVGYANRTRVATPQTITSFYADSDTPKGLSIASLHNGTNPPTQGSHFYGPAHSTARWSFFALFGGDMTEGQAQQLHDVSHQFNTRLHRHYSMSLDYPTDIFSASNDDFAGAYWSPNSLSGPDNTGNAGSENTWDFYSGGTYTVESGSQNVLFGTTAIHYSGSSASGTAITFDRTGLSVSDILVCRGYTKWLASDSGVNAKVTLYDSVNGISDHFVATSDTSSWYYFEVEHTIGEVNNNLELYIRGGGEYIVDGLELYKKV